MAVRRRDRDGDRSRRRRKKVGIYIGAIFIGLAFVPKIAALVLSIPPPVLGAYIVVIFALIFVQGMRILFREDIERPLSIVAGLAFWVGAGIQFQAIFPSHLATPAGRMLANGLTTGGLTVLLLTLFLEFTGPRRHKTEVALRPDSLPDLDRFLVGFADRYKWGEKAKDRLRAASEEAMLSLLRQEEEEPSARAEERRLRVVARNTRLGAQLEFTAGTKTGNLENEMVLLGARPDPTSERDLSLALLRHHAASVRHQQYHNIDIRDGAGGEWVTVGRKYVPPCRLRAPDTPDTRHPRQGRHRASHAGRRPGDDG